jgi:nanoRNase/pAp phosphatase (c-di-AMP/oligoRNAs hydrolase)
MILAKITSRVGGTGGGHEGAAGATVPVNVFSTFLELFKWEVSPVISRSLG